MLIGHNPLRSWWRALWGRRFPTGN